MRHPLMYVMSRRAAAGHVIGTSLVELVDPLLLSTYKHINTTQSSKSSVLLPSIPYSIRDSSHCCVPRRAGCLA